MKVSIISAAGGNPGGWACFCYWLVMVMMVLYACDDIGGGWSRLGVLVRPLSWITRDRGSRTGSQYISTRPYPSDGPCFVRVVYCRGLFFVAELQAVQNTSY